MLRPQRLMPQPRRSILVEAPTVASGLDHRVRPIVDPVETRVGRELQAAATMPTVEDPDRTRIVVDPAETPTVVDREAMPTKPGRLAETRIIRDKPVGTRWDKQEGINRGNRPGIDPEEREPTPTGTSQPDPSRFL
jgi:hypothetical protein